MQGYPVVNPDSIRLALHGQPHLPSMEPYVWAIAKTMVRSLFLAGHIVVVLDATNITERRRNEWRSDDWLLEVKYFNTPKDVCIQRAKDSNTEYLIPVIERMHKEMEKHD
jgi:predicted kinase